jgi:hypothetical protein
MLTNTAPAHAQDPTELTATTVAIEAAERRSHAALRDLARLLDVGQISIQEATELERETLARFTADARELELRGDQIVDPGRWAQYQQCAAERRADAAVERRRSPRLRGLGRRARELRERQMCVVASARVSSDVLAWLSFDDDAETLAMRGELAAAGLL